MDEQQLLRMMSGQDRSARAGLGRLGLAALEPGYRLAVAARNRMFDVGLRTPIRLPRPTLSVGNLTTGGTGKTPMVIEIVRRLAARGERPAVLLRGYKAETLAPSKPDEGQTIHDQSDEATLLAARLGPGVPVCGDPDRARAAERALSQRSDVSVFVLDDAFQHRQVHRDLDLVLVDATRPFGFDHLLPRGLLREPAENLRRADGVIVTRADQVDAEALRRLDARIADLAGRPPLAHAAYRWGVLRSGEADQPIEQLKAMRVAGACGIGNPEAFRAALADAAGEVVAFTAFNDHHAYPREQVLALLADAKAQGAEAMVVTEKDWVKWQAWGADEQAPLPVLRPRVAVVFLDGGEAVDTLLGKVAHGSSGPVAE